MADVATPLDLCILTPSQISIDIVGVNIQGGRTLGGTISSIDLSGGGYVKVIYGGITLLTAAQHRYWNMIAGFLNGGVRSIRVPLWTGPFLSVAGGGRTVLADAVEHATTIQITGGAAIPAPGEWFSMVSSGNRRAHRLLSVVGTGGTNCTCEIRPALRRDTAAGTALEFTAPECDMHLLPGTSLAWSWSAPGAIAVDLEMSFEEAFDP